MDKKVFHENLQKRLLKFMKNHFKITNSIYNVCVNEFKMCHNARRKCISKAYRLKWPQTV